MATNNSPNFNKEDTTNFLLMETLTSKAMDFLKILCYLLANLLNNLILLILTKNLMNHNLLLILDWKEYLPLLLLITLLYPLNLSTLLKIIKSENEINIIILIIYKFFLS